MPFDEYFADLLAKEKSEGEFADSLQISHILDGLEAEGVMSKKVKIYLGYSSKVRLLIPLDNKYKERNMRNAQIGRGFNQEF